MANEVFDTQEEVDGMNKISSKTKAMERSTFPMTIAGTITYYKATGQYESYTNGTCPEEIVEQFKHIFNLYRIFGEEKLKEYENFLIEKRMPFKFISKYRNMGMRRSNWLKESHIKQMTEAEGLHYTKVVKTR